MTAIAPPLPTELLHNVIALCCGDYIDSLIFEAQDSQPRFDLKKSLPSNGDASTDPIDTRESLLLKENPITAFLQVSYQVREITLSILSQGMSIPRQEDGR